MNRTLPERPDLEQLKKQAKELLQRWEENDPDILGQLAKLRKLPVEPRLSFAQFALARSYGFSSWTALKRHVEIQSHESSAAVFIEAACVAAVGWHHRPSLERAETARQLDPSVTTRDFACACVYGETETVERLLKEDASMARSKHSHRRWEPMLYLCFSAYADEQSARKREVLETARLLLAAGAEPNPSFLSDPEDPASFEPAIYGAAGILNNPDLTQLLLDHGVDPNDYETPYHAPEHPNFAALKVIWPKLNLDSRATAMLRLIDHHNYDGLEWCLKRGGDPNHRGHWEDQMLHHSIRRLNPLRFQELLIQHGADVNGRTKAEDRQGGDVPHDIVKKGGVSVYQMAARHGRKDLIDLIKNRGATADLDEKQRFIYALTTGDRQSAIQHKNLIEKLSGEDFLIMNSAAGQGDVEAVRLMLELGIPADAHGINGSTPLHYAASHGRLPVVQLLLEYGAPVFAKDMGGHTPRELTIEFRDNGWVDRPETPEIIRLLEEREHAIS